MNFWIRSVLPLVTLRTTKLPWSLLKGGSIMTGGALLMLSLQGKADTDIPLVTMCLSSLLPHVNAATKAVKNPPVGDNNAEKVNEAAEVTAEKKEKKAKRGRRMRKKFQAYASVSYEGAAYMTPEDFLLCLIEAPSKLIQGDDSSRKVLSKEDHARLLKSVPDWKKNSDKLFRSLGQNGLISFPEFVFLLCALTRSERRYKIGFMMLDEDVSGKIDFREFTQLTNLIGHEYAGEELDVDKNAEIAAKAPLPSTFLTVHLFGQNGRGKLSFEQFKEFVDNLWSEVVEIEFESIANATTGQISVIEFGRVLLRYTHLDDTEQAAYLKSLQGKAKELRLQHISFEEFKQFNRFLSHLDDFRLAMRMYSIASVSVSAEDLARAIYVSSGVRLSTELLEMIYSVFDRDGDARLSYREFVSVLHDRLNRSLRSVVSSTEMENLDVWTQWKRCVRQEYRRSV